MKPTEIALHPDTKLPNIMDDKGYVFTGTLIFILTRRLDKVIRDATEKCEAGRRGRPTE